MILSEKLPGKRILVFTKNISFKESRSNQLFATGKTNLEEEQTNGYSSGRICSVNLKTVKKSQRNLKLWVQYSESSTVEELIPYKLRTQILVEYLLVEVSNTSKRAPALLFTPLLESKDKPTTAIVQYFGTRKVEKVSKSSIFPFKFNKPRREPESVCVLEDFASWLRVQKTQLFLTKGPYSLTGSKVAFYSSKDGRKHKVAITNHMVEEKKLTVMESLGNSQEVTPDLSQFEFLCSDADLDKLLLGEAPKTNQPRHGKLHVSSESSTSPMHWTPPAWMTDSLRYTELLSDFQKQTRASVIKANPKNIKDSTRSSASSSSRINRRGRTQVKDSNAMLNSQNLEETGKNSAADNTRDSRLLGLLEVNEPWRSFKTIELAPHNDIIDSEVNYHDYAIKPVKGEETSNATERLGVTVSVGLSKITKNLEKTKSDNITKSSKTSLPAEPRDTLNDLKTSESAGSNLVTTTAIGVDILSPLVSSSTVEKFVETKVVTMSAESRNIRFNDNSSSKNKDLWKLNTRVVGVGDQTSTATISSKAFSSITPKLANEKHCGMAVDNQEKTDQLNQVEKFNDVIQNQRNLINCEYAGVSAKDVDAGELVYTTNEKLEAQNSNSCVSRQSINLPVCAETKGDTLPIAVTTVSLIVEKSKSSAIQGRRPTPTVSETNSVTSSRKIFDTNSHVSTVLLQDCSQDNHVNQVSRWHKKEMFQPTLTPDHIQNLLAQATLPYKCKGLIKVTGSLNIPEKNVCFAPPTKSVFKEDDSSARRLNLVKNSNRTTSSLPEDNANYKSHSPAQSSNVKEDIPKVTRNISVIMHSQPDAQSSISCHASSQVDTNVGLYKQVFQDFQVDCGSRWNSNLHDVDKSLCSYNRKDKVKSFKSSPAINPPHGLLFQNFNHANEFQPCPSNTALQNRPSSVKSFPNRQDHKPQSAVTHRSSSLGALNVPCEDSKTNYSRASFNWQGSNIDTSGVFQLQPTPEPFQFNATLLKSKQGNYTGANRRASCVDTVYRPLPIDPVFPVFNGNESGAFATNSFATLDSSEENDRPHQALDSNQSTSKSLNNSPLTVTKHKKGKPVNFKRNKELLLVMRKKQNDLEYTSIICLQEYLKKTKLKSARMVKELEKMERRVGLVGCKAFHDALLVANSLPKLPLVSMHMVDAIEQDDTLNWPFIHLKILEFVKGCLKEIGANPKRKTRRTALDFVQGATANSNPVSNNYCSQSGSIHNTCQYTPEVPCSITQILSTSAPSNIATDQRNMNDPRIKCPDYYPNVAYQFHTPYDAFMIRQPNYLQRMLSGINNILPEGYHVQNTYSETPNQPAIQLEHQSVLCDESSKKQQTTSSSTTSQYKLNLSKQNNTFSPSCNSSHFAVNKQQPYFSSQMNPWQDEHRYFSTLSSDQCFAGSGVNRSMQGELFSDGNRSTLQQIPPSSSTYRSQGVPDLNACIDLNSTLQDDLLDTILGQSDISLDDILTKQSLTHDENCHAPLTNFSAIQSSCFASQAMSLSESAISTTTSRTITGPAYKINLAPEIRIPQVDRKENTTTNFNATSSSSVASANTTINPITSFQDTSKVGRTPADEFNTVVTGYIDFLCKKSLANFAKKKEKTMSVRNRNAKSPPQESSQVPTIYEGHSVTGLDSFSTKKREEHNASQPHAFVTTKKKSSVKQEEKRVGFLSPSQRLKSVVMKSSQHSDNTIKKRIERKSCLLKVIEVIDAGQLHANKPTDLLKCIEVIDTHREIFNMMLPCDLCKNQTSKFESFEERHKVNAKKARYDFHETPDPSGIDRREPQQVFTGVTSPIPARTLNVVGVDVMETGSNEDISHEIKLNNKDSIQKETTTGNSVTCDVSSSGQVLGSTTQYTYTIAETTDTPSSNPSHLSNSIPSANDMLTSKEDLEGHKLYKMGRYRCTSTDVLVEDAFVPTLSITQEQKTKRAVEEVCEVVAEKDDHFSCVFPKSVEGRSGKLKQPTSFFIQQILQKKDDKGKLSVDGANAPAHLTDLVTSVGNTVIETSFPKKKSPSRKKRNKLIMPTTPYSIPALQPKVELTNIALSSPAGYSSPTKTALLYASAALSGDIMKYTPTTQISSALSGESNCSSYPCFSETSTLNCNTTVVVTTATRTRMTSKPFSASSDTSEHISVFTSFSSTLDTNMASVTYTTASNLKDRTSKLLSNSATTSPDKVAVVIPDIMKVIPPLLSFLIPPDNKAVSEVTTGSSLEKLQNIYAAAESFSTVTSASALLFQQQVLHTKPTKSDLSLNAKAATRTFNASTVFKESLNVQVSVDCCSEVLPKADSRSTDSCKSKSSLKTSSPLCSFSQEYVNVTRKRRNSHYIVDTKKRRETLFDENVVGETINRKRISLTHMEQKMPLCKFEKIDGSSKTTKNNINERIPTDANRLVFDDSHNKLERILGKQNKSFHASKTEIKKIEQEKNTNLISQDKKLTSNNNPIDTGSMSPPFVSICEQMISNAVKESFHQTSLAAFATSQMLPLAPSVPLSSTYFSTMLPSKTTALSTTTPLSTTTSPPTTLPLSTTTSPSTTLPLSTTTSPPTTLPLSTTTSPPTTLPLSTTTSPPITLPLSTTTSPPTTLPLSTTTSPPTTLPLSTTTSPPITLPLSTTTSPPTTLPLSTTTSLPTTLPLSTTTWLSTNMPLLKTTPFSTTSPLSTTTPPSTTSPPSTTTSLLATTSLLETHSLPTAISLSSKLKINSLSASMLANSLQIPKTSASVVNNLVAQFKEIKGLKNCQVYEIYGVKYARVKDVSLGLGFTSGTSKNNKLSNPEVPMKSLPIFQRKETKKPLVTLNTSHSTITTNSDLRKDKIMTITTNSDLTKDKIMTITINSDLKKDKIMTILKPIVQDVKKSKLPLRTLDSISISELQDRKRKTCSSPAKVQEAFKNARKNERSDEQEQQFLQKKRLRYSTTERKSWLQTKHCRSFPDLPKCVDCKEENDIGFCRFIMFRRLKMVSGNVHTAGYCTSVDAEPKDFLPWIFSENTMLDLENCKEILRDVGAQFEQLALQEKNAKIRGKNPDEVAWKRPVLQVREMCDVCATTIFNTHWTCEDCGFALCLDCFFYALNSPKSSTNELDWPVCDFGNLHRIDDLTITEVIPGETLQKLYVDLKSVCRKLDLKFRQLDLLKFSHHKGYTELHKYAQPDMNKLDILATVANIKSRECERNIFERYPTIDDSAECSWFCFGRMLHIQTPRFSQETLLLFKSEWRKGKPIIVSNVHTLLRKEIWTPNSFKDDFGKELCDIVNCYDGSTIENVPVGDFWEGFDSITKRPDFNNAGVSLLKLKDWPSGDDFKEKLPTRFADMMQALPAPEYTQRTGELNLASRLPNFFAVPDLGPKMYNAYGSSSYPSAGTTNLHLDISDATNVICYVGIPIEADVREKELQDTFTAVDKACCDATKRRIRDSEVRPGALWHIFDAHDADKMRQFLKRISKERGIVLSDNSDPIHDQSFYLNQELLDRLKTEEGVTGYAVCQCLGDAVYIPAGAPHQVLNLHSCIKVAEDFVAPEHITHCLQLTQEFRHLSDYHTNHEDKLQIKNIIYHTVKDCLGVVKRHHGIN